MDAHADDEATAQPVLPDTLLEVSLRQTKLRTEIRRRAVQFETARRLRVLQSRPVPSGDFGHPTHDQARALHEVLARRLHTEIAAGATVHRRIPVLLRWLPLTVTLVDGVIIYAFSADIFNVPAGDLGPNGRAAVALAVLCSSIAYGWLSITGTRLRDYRSRLGRIELRLTDGFTRLLVAVSLVIGTILGILMYLRVVEKATVAGDAYIAADQVSVLGWIFAILGFCANLTVLTVHALDGSAVAADTRRIGRALKRHLWRQRLSRWLTFRRSLAIHPRVRPIDEEASSEQQDAVATVDDQAA